MNDLFHCTSLCSFLTRVYSIKSPRKITCVEDRNSRCHLNYRFLLSLIPVSDSSCNRLCDKGQFLRIMFSSLISDGPQPLQLSFVFSNHKLCERNSYTFPSLFFSFKQSRNSSSCPCLPTTRDIMMIISSLLVLVRVWLFVEMVSFRSLDNSSVLLSKKLALEQLISCCNIPPTRPESFKEKACSGPTLIVQTCWG